jgi:hypothetical protein
MLKNNLNVFYKFLRGGIERETTDTLGNTIYYNDSENEEEQELPNYYTTYTKNKSFINVKPTKVKKTNGKFEVVSKKQFEKDKQAQINILVPFEKPNKEEEEKKIDIVKKNLSAKKIAELLYQKRVLSDKERKEYLKLHPDERKDYKEIRRRETKENKNENLDVANEYLKNRYIKDVEETKKRGDKSNRDKDLMNIYSAVPENNIVSLLNDISKTKIYKKGDFSIGEDFISRDFEILDKNNKIIGSAELKQVNRTQDDDKFRMMGLNKLIDDNGKPIKNFEGYYIFKDGSIEKITSDTVVDFLGKRMFYKQAIKKIIDIVKKYQDKEPKGEKNINEFKEARNILRKKGDEGWDFYAPRRWWKNYKIGEDTKIFLKNDLNLTDDEKKIFEEKRNKQDSNKIINDAKETIKKIDEKIQNNRKRMEQIKDKYNDDKYDVLEPYYKRLKKLEDPIYNKLSKEKDEIIKNAWADYKAKKIKNSDYSKIKKEAEEEYNKYIKSDEYKNKQAENYPKIKKINDEIEEATKIFNRTEEYSKLNSSIANLKYSRGFKEEEIKHFEDKNKTIII